MMSIQFSRAGKRRFNKKVREFISLHRKNETIFLREWDKQVTEWIKEIHFRAKQWKEQPLEKSESTIQLDEDEFFEAIDRLPVFGVYEKAEAMITASGREIEELVGPTTRQTLENECVKAIAGIYDNRLNSSLIQHWFYKRAKK